MACRFDFLEARPQGPQLAGPFAANWTSSIAVCGMMKGEALEDVKEWIAYHRCGFASVGGEHKHARVASVLLCVRVFSLTTKGCRYTLSGDIGPRPRRQKGLFWSALAPPMLSQNTNTHTFARRPPQTDGGSH